MIVTALDKRDGLVYTVLEVDNFNNVKVKHPNSGQAFWTRVLTPDGRVAHVVLP